MFRLGGISLLLLGVLCVLSEGRKGGTFSPTLDPIWIQRGQEYQQWYDKWFLNGTFRFFFVLFSLMIIIIIIIIVS